jgi:hypothetical protein
MAGAYAVRPERLMRIVAPDLTNFQVRGVGSLQPAPGVGWGAARCCTALVGFGVRLRNGATARRSNGTCHAHARWEHAPACTTPTPPQLKPYVHTMVPRPKKGERVPTYADVVAAGSKQELLR